MRLSLMRVLCLSAFLLLVPMGGGAVSFGTPVSAAPASPFTKTLRLGSRGEEVRRLQILLKQFPDLYPAGLVTGYFGHYTHAAVKRFQTKYRIPVTSRTDGKTRVQLNQITRRLRQSPPSRVTGTVAPPLSTTASQAVASPPPPTPFVLPPSTPGAPTPVKEPYFRYRWRASAELTGEVQLPTPVPRPVFVLDGKPTATLQTSAAVRLAELYHIVLADDEEPWDAFSAAMLLETIERFPKTPFVSFNPAQPVPTWHLTLTPTLLAHDIEVEGTRVRLTKAALTRSNPTLQPSTQGNPDRVFYSNRLFQAVLRAFYSESSLMVEVMRVRYGLAVGLGEPTDEFQSFRVEELQFMASVFEDLPAGFRGIPGLQKVVRRRNGLTNPLYPRAAALAWIHQGYMEFMDVAFSSGDVSYISRLVAHEMTHFLWHNVLSEDTRRQFMALSGWSKTLGPGAIDVARTVAADHPKSTFTKHPGDLWYRTTTTNFVSEYAAAHNPDEDFAEAMSYYIYQPDFVRTIAPEKYRFMKDVVDGYEYVILVDKQFTFQVFNLEPSLAFPGKIIGVDVEVYKRDDGDNRVIATLHLSSQFGTGADQAYARIVSPAQTYEDQYFYPVGGNRFMLRTDFPLSKYAARGYWLPEHITVSDRADGRRYEGQAHFGWLLFVDNSEEDLEAPYADVERIRAELTNAGGDYEIRVTIPVRDAHRVGLGGHGTIVHETSGQREGRYTDTPREGAYEEIQEVVLLFPIRSYRASGNWTFREFWLFDKAGNERRYDLKERALTFFVPTLSPDTVPPALDINTIKIAAKPRHPEAPDGETDVAIRYKARDDISGLGFVAYTLLKPNGDTLYGYHYHDNFHTPYFVGDPRELTQYNIELTLPPGSPPGTWILQELTLRDKAGNVLSVNFVELGILRPFKVF